MVVPDYYKNLKAKAKNREMTSVDQKKVKEVGLFRRIGRER